MALLWMEIPGSIHKYMNVISSFNSCKTNMNASLIINQFHNIYVSKSGPLWIRRSCRCCCHSFPKAGRLSISTLHYYHFYFSVTYEEPCRGHWVKERSDVMLRGGFITAVKTETECVICRSAACMTECSACRAYRRPLYICLRACW